MTSPLPTSALSGLTRLAEVIPDLPGASDVENGPSQDMYELPQAWYWSSGPSWTTLGPTWALLGLVRAFILDLQPLKPCNDPHARSGPSQDQHGLF